MATNGLNLEERETTFLAEGIAPQRARVLSDDERRVLGLSAEGLGRGEVADCLRWPTRRVRDCLAGAVAALGARSKLEAIIIAYRQGEL